MGDTDATSAVLDDGGDDDIAEQRPPTPQGCGDGVLEGAIYLERGPEELARLDGIGTVTGDVVIDKTDAQTLDGFQCVVEIMGDLHIFGNTQLTDLHGLDNLWRVHGHVIVSENPAIVDLDALTGLTFVGTTFEPTSLVVKNSDGLETISGLQSLTEIHGSLIIQFNPVLRAIDGLRGLRVMDGLFAVTQNPQLCLSSVNAVGEGLTEGPASGSSTRANDSGC